jgi:two-component system cell cycle sensor histidine kinase/response regulator CckA
MVVMAAAIAVTLLLTVGVVSFIVPELGEHPGGISWVSFPSAVRGLVAVVLLFDIYTIYQQLLIHRIRRKLFQGEELFALISDNASDMIAVVDMEGRRLYHSLSCQTVLGYSPEELKSSSAMAHIHLDDVERVQEASRLARVSGVGQTQEYRIQHKSGHWLVMESRASVIRNSHGRPKKMVVVSRDITERKFAQEALRLSDAGFRTVVEDAPYGIYRTDDQGQLLRVNPALQKMLGYETALELLRVNPQREIFRAPAEFTKLIQVLNTGEYCKDVEAEWKTKNGTPITVKRNGRRLGGEDDGSIFFEMFVEDVTDKRILERQVRMAGKMEAIGRLSGGIAHDFNNLLGVIIGYSQVVIRALGKQNPLTEHVIEIEKAGDRAAALTRQLLAFSRQQILSPTVLNLNDLVEDMQKMLPRPIGEDITMSMSMVMEPELSSVLADRNQIEQVIMNLAVNARDAMPEGGALRIETKNIELDEAYSRLHPGAKPGQYVCLTVSDTGMGMDAETQAHIFEPFFTTKEMGKGTGLGLATVYGVVKQSCGYVWVDSRPGEGASFQIFLPRVAQVSETVAAGPEPDENLRGSETILLVEDSEPLRKLAASLLAGRGFTVLSAANAEQATKVAAGHFDAIHLLMTDVIMPGENGRVLAERLVRTYPRLKVLYISDYTDSFIAGHRVLDAGSHLLNKPFTEESLIRKVREVLDGQPSPRGKLSPAGDAEAIAVRKT